MGSNHRIIIMTLDTSRSYCRAELEAILREPWIERNQPEFYDFSVAFGFETTGPLTSNVPETPIAGRRYWLIWHCNAREDAGRRLCWAIGDPAMDNWFLIALCSSHDLSEPRHQEVSNAVRVLDYAHWKLAFWREMRCLNKLKQSADSVAVIDLDGKLLMLNDTSSLGEPQVARFSLTSAVDEILLCGFAFAVQNYRPEDAVRDVVAFCNDFRAHI